jgi:3-oxoacyl-(acyl-carrier-protein) synthase
MSKKRVAITGLGPICSLGYGASEVWDSLMKLRLNLVRERYLIDGEEWGTFHLHKMRDFDVRRFGIPEESLRFIRELRTVRKEDTDLYYFLAMISLALKDSGLRYDPKDNAVGLLLTHENPGVETFFEELIDSAYELFNKFAGKKMSKLALAQGLYDSGCEERGYNLQSFSYLFAAAKAFDLHGYSLFVNNACASGLFAIESAARQIRSGASPAVVVAAADNPTKVYKYLWFRKKGLYAEDGITRPFARDGSGIVFGDGGAALVLEDLEHARARKARVYGEYLGGGFSLEGWKITVPDVTGDYYERSLRMALDGSGVGADEIDFVNPHGVGMKITDAYEAKAIRNVFAGRMPRVSAFKPLCGHNLGGSALLETAIALLALENGVIPATLNCDNVDEAMGLDIVTKNEEARMRTIAKMSCGFAGYSGVGIFRKAGGIR